jgi:hypothetical protein
MHKNPIDKTNLAVLLLGLFTMSRQTALSQNGASRAKEQLVCVSVRNAIN